MRWLRRKPKPRIISVPEMLRRMERSALERGSEVERIPGGIRVTDDGDVIEIQSFE